MVFDVFWLFEMVYDDLGTANMCIVEGFLSPG